LRQGIFNTASLSEQAEEALTDEILSGRLSPDQRVDLSGYASRWHLSQMPLRDAVKRLESRGLVVIRPRRGVFVARLDPRAIREIYEIRIALECMAVELATPLIPEKIVCKTLASYNRAKTMPQGKERQTLLSEIDTLVHSIVVEYAENSRLKGIIRGLSDLIRWSQATSYQQAGVSYDEALPEHIEILEAIQTRDVAAATAAMRHHLSNTLARIETKLHTKTLATK
jgi:DNA-binding GntR family transcriptional regulator